MKHGPIAARKTFKGPPSNPTPIFSCESILRPVELPFKIWLWSVSLIHLCWLFLFTEGSGAIFAVALIFILVPGLIALLGLGNRLWALFVCTAVTSFLAWTVFEHFTVSSH